MSKAPPFPNCCFEIPENLFFGMLGIKQAFFAIGGYNSVKV